MQKFLASIYAIEGVKVFVKYQKCVSVSLKVNVKLV